MEEGSKKRRVEKKPPWMTFFLLLIGVIWIIGPIVKGELERRNLNQVRAQELAINYMRSICIDGAQPLGLRCQDYVRFEPMPTSTRSYEFQWIYPSGILLAITVSDNGLFVNYQYSWWKKVKDGEGFGSYEHIDGYGD